jgi:hypothetical protein
MGLEGRNSFNVALSGDKWWDFVNTAMNSRVEKIREISWLAEQLLASEGKLCTMGLRTCTWEAFLCCPVQNSPDVLVLDDVSAKGFK